MISFKATFPESSKLAELSAEFLKALQSRLGSRHASIREFFVERLIAEDQREARGFAFIVDGPEALCTAELKAELGSALNEIAMQHEATVSELDLFDSQDPSRLPEELFQANYSEVDEFLEVCDFE